MKRVKKAVFAGAGAAVSAVWAALINGDKPATSEGWAALIAGGVAAGLVTGVGVYFARNTGPGIQVGGSEATRLVR